MEKETGISFGYQESQEGYDSACITLSERMPWFYNDKEKGLTEDSLRTILEKYADELNIKDENIDYTKNEYWG